MNISNHKLLFLFAFFVYSAINTYAQNNTWLAIMTDGTQSQSHSAESISFPEQFINQKWDAQ
jgi:hypothetical protein